MGITFSTNQKNKNVQEIETDKHYDEEFNALIRDCDFFLLAYILKTATNEENAMSISDIADSLDLLIPRNESINNKEKDPSFFPERTIRRRIEVFSRIEESDLELTEKIRSLLHFVMGGRITYRAADGINNGSNTKSNGKQKRFYFDPVLSIADMDLIFGSIRSNRFLSEDEKEYLLARLHILLPEYNFEKEKMLDNARRHILEINDLPEKPKPKRDITLPMDSSKLLSHIQTIYDAIQNEVQIEVVYGTYDIVENSSKVDFHPRNPDKPHILNPFAMMWYGGEYYLIATHYNYTNPVHYRIDRIISVKIHTAKNKEGELEEIKRRPIPNTLKRFFHKNKDEKLTFDSLKYANTYPGMKLYDNDNKIDVVFECTSISLQILIDYFGPDIKLAASPIMHSADELDYNGNKQKFLSAKICGVQYDNAYRFAIAQSEYLTLLGPDELVKAVADKIQNIADRYKNISIAEKP